MLVVINQCKSPYNFKEFFIDPTDLQNDSNKNNISLSIPILPITVRVGVRVGTRTRNPITHYVGEILFIGAHFMVHSSEHVLLLVKFTF